VVFCDFWLYDVQLEWMFAEITGNRPSQPAYEINWCCRASPEH